MQPSSEPRERKSTPKSERTKERILRAAERLFAEHGFDGVSVRQIAAAADVQLALLSYYFETKEGLYRAVFRRRIEPIAEERRRQLREVMERKDPPPRRDPPRDSPKKDPPKPSCQQPGQVDPFDTRPVCKS